MAPKKSEARELWRRIGLELLKPFAEHASLLSLLVILAGIDWCRRSLELEGVSYYSFYSAELLTGVYTFTQFATRVIRAIHALVRATKDEPELPTVRGRRKDEKATDER